MCPMIILYIYTLCLHVRIFGDAAATKPDEMFKRLPWMRHLNTRQLNYGVAVSDVDNDGKMDWIVAGYSGDNFVFKYNEKTKQLDNLLSDSKFEALKDNKGRAIGVTACDIDGDGREEIYFLNTNGAYAGRSSYGDKLFKWRNGTFVDLFSDPVNRNIQVNQFAGRSVACVDRLGTGIYSIALATYSVDGVGQFALVEMDATHNQNDVSTGKIVLKNVALIAGIQRATGGRGIVVGPIVSSYRSDIFFGNEGNPWMGNPGNNFLFKNLGNGSFQDIAQETGVDDSYNNARGVTVADFNQDGLIDIVCGNWEGKHKLFMQQMHQNGTRTFRNVANKQFEKPSKIRTVIAADFDNDGSTEIFMNNIPSYRNPSDRQPNKLFNIKPNPLNASNNPIITKLNIGRAKEPRGFGTGAAVADMDRDGSLDLLVSHGESAMQSLQVYKVNRKMSRGNNWLRVFPRTKYGAPARGALVKLITRGGKVHTSIIDGGSGYLCEMEPIAHFGLGTDKPRKIVVIFSDGKIQSEKLKKSDKNKVHIVDHPDKTSIKA